MPKTVITNKLSALDGIKVESDSPIAEESTQEIERWLASIEEDIKRARRNLKDGFASGCKRRNKSAAGGGGKVQRPATIYPTHCGVSTLESLLMPHHRCSPVRFSA